MLSASRTCGDLSRTLAAAQRPEIADVERQAVVSVQIAIVIVGEPDAKMQLQVRAVDVGTAADEPARFRRVRGQEPAAMTQKFDEVVRRAQELAGRQAEKPVAVDADIGGVVAVVVQIARRPQLASAIDLDAEALQMVRWADAGKHQELRRPEGAGAQHDFSASRETAFAA